MTPDRALFIGRFQPFHHGHRSVVEKLLAGHGEVIICVGSAETPMGKENPFSAGERIEMIRAAFTSGQLSRILIIPVRDVNDHSRWVGHVKSLVPSFSAVYSNNEVVAGLFHKAGIPLKPVEFFDRGPKEGRLIRELMAKGDAEWKKHVPEGTVKFIERIKGEERIAGLSKPV